MTAAAILALLIGSWGCTETVEKVSSKEMTFASDATVVTRYRAHDGTGAVVTTRERFAVRNDTVEIAPMTDDSGPTVLYTPVMNPEKHAMMLRARSVRPHGAKEFMAFPDADQSLCRKLDDAGDFVRS
jgi:hypothetical protein